MNFANEELELINSLYKPIENVDINLVNSIIDKMVRSKKYKELIDFLNLLYDFSGIDELFENFAERLITENNKECISFFLDEEENLDFFDNSTKHNLITFLNSKKIYIKLNNTYDYYYKMLFSQGLRSWKNININENLVEHSYTRYNKLIKFKIIEDNNFGVIILYTNYLNYNLSYEEQILKAIDYLNEFGFNIERSIESIMNESLITKMIETTNM